MTIESLSALIESEIRKLKFPEQPRGLYEPISYILELGGKRMRPVLTLLGYSMFRQDPERIAKEALSVEVFHNFTLMHDDIMDHAPLRRGKATVHEKWDQTTAILSGDAMLIKAYQLIEGLEADLLSKSFRLFNQCALEVCEGQQLDMELESVGEATVEQYLDMIRLKTAVLVGYSLQFGGLLALQDEATQQKLHELGVSMGMAFQLMDDHLDTFGNDSFGKKIGGDILANKKTFLLISALASDEREDIQKWIHSKASDEKIQTMTDLYKKASVDELSKKEIFKYGEKAKTLLEEIDGNGEAKLVLENYIAQLNKRVV